MRAVCIGAALGLCHLATAQPDEPNLAPTPGFETDADGNGSPDGWNPWGTNNRPANVFRDSDQPHSGQYCLRARDDSAADRQYPASDYIRLDIGRSYLLSIWVRGDGEGRIRFDQLDPDKQYLGAVVKDFTATPDWQIVRLAVSSVNPRTGFVQISLEPCRGGPEVTGTIWCDDVMLQAFELKKVILQPDESWFPFPIPWRDSGPSALDVSSLLDPPTGRHGFLKARDGHFFWADGTRARFWGTNIHSSRACFPTHEQAESFARRLARQGVNLVRLHLLENPSPSGLVDDSYDDSQHLSEAQFEKLDYLLYQFHLNGIYVVPDALPMCARRWKPGDHVPEAEQLGLGAFGASYFAPEIIKIEEGYARAFLGHYNPYTKKRYAQDPTIAMLEFTNENTLFLLGKWRGLPPHYQQLLQGMWNDWLARKYKTRDDLKRAWTDATGACALGDPEDQTKGTVALTLVPGLSSWNRPNVGPTAPCRVNDASLFLYEVQRAYHERMGRFLHELGVRVPVTASNINSDEAGLKSYEVLDFTDSHSYWDHPSYEGGNEAGLTNKPLIRQDPLATGTLVNELAPAKVSGQPVVFTEWNSLWPNEFRAADVLTTTAYACLQDWDAVFIYCYYGGWGLSFDEAKPKIHHATVIFSDPAEAGLFPACASLFLRHDVAAARNLIEVGFSHTDTFFPQGSPRKTNGIYPFAPYVSRVTKTYFDDAYAPTSDGVSATVASGNSASGDYAKARRLLLFADNPWVDPFLKRRDVGASAKVLYPGLRFAAKGRFRFQFDEPGLGIPGGVLETELDGAIDLASLPPGAVPFGVDKERGACVGLLMGDRAIAPAATQLLARQPAFLARLFTECGRRWGLLEADQGFLPDGRLVSDTGELSRDWRRGVCTIDTPRTAGAAGFLGAAGPFELSHVRVDCGTDFAVILLTSLDGKELTESDHILVTAVGRAANTGQQLETVAYPPGAEPAASGRGVRVASMGHEPVLAQPVEGTISVERGGAASGLTAYALDPDGKRKAGADATTEGGRLSVRLARDAETIYYELVR